MAGDPATQRFVPIWSGELEVTAPSLPERLTEGTTGRPFERARLLVCASGTPLGFIEVETPDGVPAVEQAVSLARRRFGEEISAATADAGWTSDQHRRVSIVLCTHNRPAGAARTLESLRALRHGDLEIIVVDNAPSDESTLTAVSEVARVDPRVRHVREPDKGLSRARNRGLREATGEVIAFTDDDCLVDPLWVHGLLRGFNRRPDVACVTGLVASSSLAQPAEQYFDRRVWWSSSCEQRIYTREPGPDDSPLHPYTPGVFGTGANFAVRADVVRSLGGFDQSLGAGSPTRGGEDLDFFVRLIAAGHALSYEPSALVWHEHRVDDVALRAQMYAYGLGLTAYLTKYLLSPGSRTELARRVPRGTQYALGLLRRSRHAGEQSSVQGDMTGVELRGMLAGPAAYLRARRAQDPAHVRAVAP